MRSSAPPGYTQAPQPSSHTRGTGMKINISPTCCFIFDGKDEEAGSQHPEEAGNNKKSLKNQAKTGQKDGGPCWNRTSDQVIMSHLSVTQKSLKTLGENDTGELSVTQSVTSNTENAIRQALLQTLKNMPKEELVTLLAAAISNEGNHTKA